ncbi:hypothetical protein BH09ACT3_BH09ACT3_08570 [soil metagenome]
MLRWRPSTDSEAGSASLEFITTGMILLLPLVYLTLTMSELQAGSLAVEGAARQAVRLFVQSESVEAATARSERAVDFALADHGLPPGSATVAVSCTPRPAECLQRGSLVTVAVATTVALPLVPPVLDLDVALSIPVRSVATERVSRFWGAG